MRRLLPALLLFLAASTPPAHTAPRRTSRVGPPIRWQAPRPGPVRLRIAGKVLSPVGRPAGGARVLVRWISQSFTPQMLELRTGADGKFAGSIRADWQFNSQVPLLALHAGAAGQALLPLMPAGVNSTNIPLKPGVTLKGRLVGTDGKPQPGVQVSVTDVAPNSQPGFAPPGQMKPLARIFTTRSASDGRFFFTGLPREGKASLDVSNGLALASGSAEEVDLLPVKEQEAGLFVVMGHGGFKVRVTNAASGKPAPGVRLLILPTPLNIASALMAGSLGPSGGVSDAQGEFEARDLPPGNYAVYAQGARLVATVEAGKTTGPLHINTRVGPLKGRLVDVGGKPVPGVPVSWAPDASSMPELEPLLRLASSFESGSFQETTTDAHGRFSFEDFDWGAGTTTLSARRGNELAEWKGPSSEIGKTIELRLRPGILTTVAGRLVGIDRKPLSKRLFGLIRWQETPRLTWVLSARKVVTDADGRFRVHGLPRGHSFSIISSFPGLTGSGGSSPGKEFESPRFDTAPGPALHAGPPGPATLQELGDIVVHPLDGPAQVLQLYGFDSPQQLRRAVGLLQPRAEEDLALAREAIRRYNDALGQGDIAALQRLTSRISSAWSDDRQEFLLRSRLAPLPTPDQERPLRFTPRFLPATFHLLLQGLTPQAVLGLDFGAAARQVEANPDWLFLTSAKGGQVRLSTVLRREEGEWRVVHVPQRLLGGGNPLDGFGGADIPGEEALALPAPAPAGDGLQAARIAGERFLTAWSSGDEAAALALVSPLSPLTAPNASVLRKRMSQRADEGIPPMDPGQPVALTPVEGLTQWDAAFLAAYARSSVQLSSLGASPPPSARDFPAAYAKRGDIAPFRYTTRGEEYVMLLVRHKGRWQVLEPALPL